jgi:hypothetical protein
MKLDRVKQGATPTLLDEKKANELIDAANAILALTVSPAGLGSFQFSNGNGVLKLNVRSVKVCIDNGDGTFTSAFKKVVMLD